MYPPVPQQRPTGVLILAILYFVQGIFALIGAFTIAAIFGSFVGLDPSGGAGAVALICGGLFVIIALIDFLIGWGLYTLQAWARTLAIIFAIIGLINFPIGTIISIIVLIYLFQPEIKYAFGQGPPPAAAYYPPPGYAPQYPPPYAPPPGYQPPAQPPMAPPPAAPAPPTNCPRCGAPISPGTKFCPSCGSAI